MLKRLWVVIAVCWSGFWLVIGLTGADFLTNPAYLAWVISPWVLGAVVWVSWLFVRSGRRRTEALARRDTN